MIDVKLGSGVFVKKDRDGEHFTPVKDVSISHDIDVCQSLAYT